MVQEAYTYVEKTPNLDVKLKLIDTLRTITAGKVCFKRSHYLSPTASVYNIPSSSILSRFTSKSNAQDWRRLWREFARLKATSVKQRKFYKNCRFVRLYSLSSEEIVSVFLIIQIGCLVLLFGCRWRRMALWRRRKRLNSFWNKCASVSPNATTFERRSSARKSASSSSTTKTLMQVAASQNTRFFITSAYFD